MATDNKGKGRRIKRLKAKPKEEVKEVAVPVIPPPIYYLNRTNYTEVAALIREQFIKSIYDSDALGGPVTEDDIELDSFSDFLDKGLTHEALVEFLRTEFGKGILLGQYLAYKFNKDQEEERKALAEQEGEGWP